MLASRILAAAALLLTLTAVGTAQGPAAAPPGAPSADELARRLQARYDRVWDFTANFEQTYRGGVLRKTTTERGTLIVKKPGRMRWTYTAPEEKLFVADGQKMYIYVPADRQVIVRTMPPPDAAPTPLMFLGGRGDLTRDFEATFTTVPAAPRGSWALKLTPRRAQADYEWLALVVDPGTLQLRMLVARDAQGGVSTFVFTNMKENSGASDKLFSFRIPRGADVITEG